METMAVSVYTSTPGSVLFTMAPGTWRDSDLGTHPETSHKEKITICQTVKLLLALSLESRDTVARVESSGRWVCGREHSKKGT